MCAGVRPLNVYRVIGLDPSSWTVNQDFEVGYFPGVGGVILFQASFHTQLSWLAAGMGHSSAWAQCCSR
jgi:hypothetical protein